MKREQEEISTEDKPMEKQPKHEEENQEEEGNNEEVPDEENVEEHQEVQDNNEEDQQEDSSNNEEVPDEEFLKAELACEIYNALPAAAQRRLLVLCQKIFELGPSPDAWVRWKIFTWAGNKWNVNDRGRGIELSPDGLSISRVEGRQLDLDDVNSIRAVHAAFPPHITSSDPIQVCYYETKFVHNGDSKIGFFGGNADLNRSFTTWSYIGMYCDAGGILFLPQFAPLPDNFQAGDVAGCGLVKHSGGKQRIFYTKNGAFLASLPLPSDAVDHPLFPAITVAIDDDDLGPRFTDTNFGLKPFLFKYQGKEQMLLNGLGRDFEMEA